MQTKAQNSYELADLSDEERFQLLECLLHRDFLTQYVEMHYSTTIEVFTKVLKGTDVNPTSDLLAHRTTMSENQKLLRLFRRLYGRVLQYRIFCVMRYWI